MKQLNQIESLRSKAQTATQIRKVEQKRIETSMIYGEDVEDDPVFCEAFMND